MNISLKAHPSNWNVTPLNEAPNRNQNTYQKQ
jgi:hypothetical protein